MQKARSIHAAAFRVRFDLGGQTLGRAPGFPNAQSLEAFVRGAESMRAYQENQKQSDLVAAIERLRIVEQEMPKFEQGLSLLALALAEARREEQAIRIMDNYWRPTHRLPKRRSPSLARMRRRGGINSSLIGRSRTSSRTPLMAPRPP